MKRLLNTLFVTNENTYLTVEGENIVAKREGEVVGRFPLHNLSDIITFSYSGASPGLMGKCAEYGIGLSFCNPAGKFLARTSGANNGNVLLRRKQYRIADNSIESLLVAKNMVFAKVYNSRWGIERTRRDHRLRIDDSKLENASQILKGLQNSILMTEDMDSLRGIEGIAASVYFQVFDELILRDKEHFLFRGRNRRPPRDRVNALLSFAYGLLAHACSSALESVGLDSYVGFMHTDRPGRESLALDIMEELRPAFADRFVLTVINNRVIRADDFVISEDGACRLSDAGRKRFLQAWQERKKEEIKHPFLQEKMAWGLVPYTQGLLLNRYLRGDIDEYPPFLWK